VADDILSQFWFALRTIKISGRETGADAGQRKIND